MNAAKVFTVVLVSPSDVSEERTIAEATIYGLRRFASSRDLTLSVLKWEDVPGGYYPAGIQDRIQQELDIEHCDLLVALFWTRFGAIDKPPYSRTATEVLSAMAAKRQRGTPEVIVYFCRKPSTPASKDETDDHGRVLEFKAEIRRDEVLTRDFLDRADLVQTLLFDVLDYIDKVSFEGQVPNDLRCQMSCVRSFVRFEGYTEAIGDIQIALTGILPLDVAGDIVSVDVKISFPTNITSRISYGGVYDAVVLTRGGEVLAKGHMAQVVNTAQNNTLFFTAVPLGPGGSRFDEILAIKGIRLDVEFLAVAVTFASPPDIFANIEITLTGREDSRPAIGRLRLAVAKLGHSPYFSIRQQSTSAAALCLSGENDDVYAFSVHVEGRVADALRTHAQEGAVPRRITGQCGH